MQSPYNRKVYDLKSLQTLPGGKIIRLQSVFIFLAWLVLLPLAGCLPDEAMGQVTNIVDGDTFDVQLREHDSRITEDLIRIRIADVDCPEIDTADGPATKAFTAKWLLDKQVYLDLDDKRGKDPYDRWVAVVYLTKPDGSLDTSQNFNRMLVDNGQACIWDFDDNEFNPASWWGWSIPSTACVKSDTDTTSSFINLGEASTIGTGIFSSPPALQESTGSSYASSTGSFVGSIKSNKYHYPSCQWAQKIAPSNEIWFSSSQDARNHGYVPCKVCNPP